MGMWENRSVTCGLHLLWCRQSGTLFFLRWRHISLFLWINGEKLEQNISDIEAVRKMLYRCISADSDITVGVTKVYQKLYDTIWCLNRSLCQNWFWSWNRFLETGMMSSLLSFSLALSWSWFHWWLWLVRLPASSEVFSSATAASLHVSLKIKFSNSPFNPFAEHLTFKRYSGESVLIF